MNIISAEDTDTDSSTSGVQPPAPKKMFANFKDSWLSHPSFKPWLAKCEGNPYEAKCLVCDKLVQAKKYNLLRHNSSKLHLESMGAVRMDVGGTTSDDLVKKTELRYVLDIVHHSQSFRSYEHYVKMIKAAHPDCNCVSLQKMRLKRSKISAIIKNVISKTIAERTARLLKGKFFTILIDESTDIAGIKALCILVRCVHEAKIHTYLLDYVKAKEATAEHLYQYLQHSLQKSHLSTKNIIGISTGNASVMLGNRKSVVALLLKENPNIAVFPCICHNMHLLASDACKCLPRNLALYQCVNRVLEQWNSLNKFFDLETTGTSESDSCTSQSESRLSDTSDTLHWKKSSVEIATALRCKYTKAYLEFVEFTLNIITKFNKIFQTSELLVHNLLGLCNKFLKEIGCNFINHTVIAEVLNLHDIDPFKIENLLPLESMYIGGKAKCTLEEIRKEATGDHEQEQITKFLETCQQFYQTAYKGAIKRLPFKDNFVKALEFLEPSVALDNTKHKDQIDCILNKFTSMFDVPACHDEWHALGYLTVREQNMKEHLLNLDVIKFWHEINVIREPDGTRPFKNISNLAMVCLSLSHSNAEIERFFSVVNEIKTPDRRRLKPEMVAALGRIKLEFRNTNTECYNFVISDDFLKKFNSTMYHKEIIPEQFSNIIVTEVTSESDSDCN